MEISESDFVIAALSYSDDPNIYYEIGLAHASGKPIQFFGEKGAETPRIRDLSIQSYVLYTTSSQGRNKLRHYFQQFLEDFKRGRPIYSYSPTFYAFARPPSFIIDLEPISKPL